MLEEHVIFESNGAEAAKYWGTHKMVRVGSESVYYIWTLSACFDIGPLLLDSLRRETATKEALTVVVPHVNHWNLRIRHAEQTLRKPHGVPLEVEGLKFFLNLMRKSGIALMDRVFDIKPVTKQRTLLHDGIVVDLIPATDHHMERLCLMAVEYITPKWIRTGVLVRTKNDQIIPRTQGLHLTQYSS